MPQVKAFSSFNARIEPALHQKLIDIQERKRTSFRNVVEEALQDYVLKDEKEQGAAKLTNANGAPTAAAAPTANAKAG